MIKNALIFVVVAMLGTPLLRASLSDKEVANYRDAVLKNGAHAVLKTHTGRAYLFEIASRGRTTEILLVFGEDVMKQPEGDVFVRVSDAAAPQNAPNGVAWSKVTAAESARFFYAFDYSEMLNLGKRNDDDPFKTVVLGPGTSYKCTAKREGREITVERQRGDSLAADYLFNFLVSAFVRRLETQ